MSIFCGPLNQCFSFRSLAPLADMYQIIIFSFVYEKVSRNICKRIITCMYTHMGNRWSRELRLWKKILNLVLVETFFLFLFFFSFI